MEHGIEMSEESKQEQADLEEMRNRTVSINGIDMTLGQLFPNEFDIKEFASKLDLLEIGNKPSKAETLATDVKATLEI